MALEGGLKSLMEDVSSAAQRILNCAKEGGFVYVVSHIDADGLAAAGIIGTALARLDVNFKIRTYHWIDDKLVESIAFERPDLVIFTDLGSGYLDVLSERLSHMNVIILDHHQPAGEAATSFVHVNPHVHGIDGSKDLSGAGATYLVAKALNASNVDLACTAVVGALGDLQDKHDQRSLGGVNEVVVNDAINAGYLAVEKDLVLFGRETRPIHKALARTTSPFIPEVSGDESKSLVLLASVGIDPKHGDRWRALRDLSADEKAKLCSALVERLKAKGLVNEASSLIGSVYTLVREEPWTPLRDGREFAVLLNATGRMGRPSLGTSICMGDRGAALEEAERILEEYRRTITKHMSWLVKTERVEELNGVYVVRGEDQVDDKLIGTIASILSTSLPNVEKPILAYALAPNEGVIKASARASEAAVRKGLNLGEILRAAAEMVSGKGGGHDAAAGAQVPVERIEEFVRIVDELVRRRRGA